MEDYMINALVDNIVLMNEDFSFVTQTYKRTSKNGNVRLTFDLTYKGQEFRFSALFDWYTKLSGVRAYNVNPRSTEVRIRNDAGRFVFKKRSLRTEVRQKVLTGLHRHRFVTVL